MNILLQNKMTLKYVGGGGGWTAKPERARVFGTGLEAIFFCLNHQVADMQILGTFADARLNSAVPVTDRRED